MDALKDKAFGRRKGLVHSSDIDAAHTIDAIPVEATAKRLQRAFFSDSWEAWAEWLRGNYSDEDFAAHVDRKKDAIPVEWLREWQAEVGELNEWWPIIERIITVWHEEQEVHGT